MAGQKLLVGGQQFFVGSSQFLMRYIQLWVGLRQLAGGHLGRHLVGKDEDAVDLAAQVAAGRVGKSNSAAFCKAPKAKPPLRTESKWRLRVWEILGSNQ
jgi:hypothetical protein